MATLGVSDAPYPGRICPHCEQPADGSYYAPDQSQRRAEPGDLNLCLYCGGWCVVDAAGGLRIATRQDLATVPQEQRDEAMVSLALFRLSRGLHGDAG